MKLRYLVVFLLTGCMNQQQSFSQSTYGNVIKVDAGTYGLIKDAVLDFQYQLSKATGKDFTIDNKDTTRTTGIQLIKLNPNTNRNFDKRLDPDNDDAVLIQSEGGQSLKIIAYSKQGLINGIYTYLDTLGFRWYHPGDKWAIVPALKYVSIKIDKVYKPDFALRSFFGTWGTPRNRPIDKNFSLDRDWNIWSMRNRLGGAYNLKGHAWGDVVGKWHDYLKERPEEMALVNGKRTSPDNSDAKFCLSNEDFQKVFVFHMTRQLNQMIKDNPDAPRYCVSVEPSDGEGDCECEACKKMGNNSTRVFNMANLVAKAFQKISPRAYVNLYAYNTHAAVPDLELEPNVIVQIIPYKYQDLFTPEAMINVWSKKCKNLFIYDYYGLPLLNVDMPLHNVLAPWRYADRVKYWHQQNIKGLTLESSYSIGCTGVGLYLYARLGWDASADQWQILKEYYHQCYGGAYEAVWQAQLTLADDSLEKSKTLKHVMSTFKAATGRVKPDPEQKERLTDFKAYMHYLKLLYDMQRADVGAGDTTTVDNLLRYVYGIYFRNEVHPFAINMYCIQYSHSSEFVKKYWSTFNQLAVGMRYSSVVQLTDEQIDDLFERDCKEKDER